MWFLSRGLGKQAMVTLVRALEVMMDRPQTIFDVTRSRLLAIKMAAQYAGRFKKAAAILALVSACCESEVRLC